MASGCWIIRLQEEDHPEQSLHEVDDLDHSLHDAGSSDFRKGMIWITHFTNRRNCFAVMDHQLCEARSSSITHPRMWDIFPEKDEQRSWDVQKRP